MMMIRGTFFRPMPGWIIFLALWWFQVPFSSRYLIGLYESSSSTVVVLCRGGGLDGKASRHIYTPWYGRQPGKVSSFYRLVIAGGRGREARNQKPKAKKTAKNHGCFSGVDEFPLFFLVFLCFCVFYFFLLFFYFLCVSHHGCFFLGLRKKGRKRKRKGMIRLDWVALQFIHLHIHSFIRSFLVFLFCVLCFFARGKSSRVLSRDTCGCVVKF